MKAASIYRFKVAAGLVLGVAIGVVCRLAEIPSPAPSVTSGALLVMAMTLGYRGADRLLAASIAVEQFDLPEAQEANASQDSHGGST